MVSRRGKSDPRSTQMGEGARFGWRLMYKFPAIDHIASTLVAQ